jgi:hypothetical protein
MNYEIKITGSGTQEEIAEALRGVANNILGAGAGNPEGVKDELNDVEWEDATLMTLVSLKEEEEEVKYRLTGFNEIHVVGSHGVSLNEKICDEELHEYKIAHRQDLVDDLYRWIGEGNEQAQMMKDDLKMIEAWTDDYIFSSISTNAYISSECSEFNETCEELIKLSEGL